MQDFLEESDIVFWDFDGVIKETNQLKADAFVNLFKNCSIETRNKIRDYHNANEGVSRYEKIPLFLKWADLPNTDKDVSLYCNLFSRMVFEGVLNCDWVPGVHDKLSRKKINQKFVLVSATPEKELCSILHNIKIYRLFDKVFGSPTLKADAIKSFLKNHDLSSLNVVMIGDSLADYEASLVNEIDFVLRCHENNAFLQKTFNGIKIKDFLF